MTITHYDEVENQNVISNREVEITSLYFRSPGSQRQERLEAFPKQMIYDGREYTFIESGLRFLVRKGQQLIELFDVSDGQRQYRLRCENDHWTLVGIKALA